MSIETRPVHVNEKMTRNVNSTWLLILLTMTWVCGELGHFIIGVITKEVAQELEYGDQECMPLKGFEEDFQDRCKGADNEVTCLDIRAKNDSVLACTWDFTGSGIEYQLLAGPSFIGVFTVAGVFWGICSDKPNVNRVLLLSIATSIFSLSIVLMAFAQQYWHLVVLRMMLAAGEAACSPLAAGMISDAFPSNRRALAMSIFNWGIYVGYGLSYAVGTYVTEANIYGRGWRSSVLLSGVPGFFVAVFLFLTISDRNLRKKDTITDPKTMDLSEEEVNKKTEESSNDSGQKSTLLSILSSPVVLILGLAACVRHTAGFCWGYNSALYYETYYPSYDVGWWLTGVSIFGGASGAAFGGYFSDKLVKKMGIASRALVLGLSQIIATPFALGVLLLSPPYSFISLIFGYSAAEMWFGVMFAILVELFPSTIKSSAVAVTLFLINNFGGNLPIVIDPLKSVTNFRTALIILYPGALFASSILFFLCYALIKTTKGKSQLSSSHWTVKTELSS